MANTGSLFSSSWYRVAQLRPRLRRHAEIHRHTYRGQIWYVLQDRSAERFHRFSPMAYTIIGFLDGLRTVQDIWDAALQQMGDDVPTQDEVIDLLGQLHAADAIQCEVPPDSADLFRRYEQQRRQSLQRRLLSIFAWQFPLVDPERFLRVLLPYVRPWFSWPGLILWAMLVVPSVFVAASHWDELTEGVLDRLTTSSSLVLLWLLFPLIKIIHELGHAFAVKAFGGEVHEIGVMLLVLTPVPYVDASAAWGFGSKWHRVVVGAAGMLVELLLAAVAVFIWVSVQPGIVRTLAYNSMLIAGVSTVLFNANPLLRFDGYYILSDFLEIPNLRTRATAYLGYLTERYLLGHRDRIPPLSTRGERGWFVSFGIASFLYRTFVMAVIIFALMDQFFIVGVVFGILTGIMSGVIPMGKAITFVCSSPRIREVRIRAIIACLVLLSVLIGLVALIPIPFGTRSEGVVWIPEEAFVRAGTEGFIRKVLVKPNTWVNPGDLLILCDDPELSTEVMKLEFQLKELNARYRQEYISNMVKAQVLLEQRRYVDEQLSRARERARELSILSKNSGQFDVNNVEDLAGRFLKQGEQVGYVVDPGKITIRTLVPQDDIDLIRHEVVSIDVRPAERIAEVLPARLKRIVPGASEELPSLVLGTEGGGEIALDPHESKSPKAMQKLFQVDLELLVERTTVNAGGRVLVRFNHGSRPIADQLYRQIRQLFLSRFNV